MLTKVIKRCGGASLWAALLMGSAVLARAQEQVQIERQVTATRSALAIIYPEGSGSISVKFKGTERLPKSSGEAKVQRKKGMTEIEIELDEMKPATFFGGDYATYVLWVVSPEGHTDNVGEFILQGNRSKLNVSTPLDTFGMFVTAEPHFLMDVPSRFIVLENTRPKHNITGRMLDVSNIKYHGYDGIYNATQETLENDREVKGETRSDVRQAKVSLMLAERAQADKFAADDYAKAKDSFQKVAEAAEANVDKRILMTMGHETVRLAVAAEKLAKERSMQAALDAERASRQQEISSLKISIEKAESDTERARLQAKQKELDLEMEQAARKRAQDQADLAARRAAEAEEQARRAQLQSDEAKRLAAAAQDEKLKAQLQAGAAQSEAEKAKQERDAARQRMRDALSVVVETRETARGLIVNLPDILFEFGKSSLKPEAREKLSKVCGILLVAQGYDLSIEGHTDNIGSEEFNQKLSEQRAGSVQSYLSSCGLPQNQLTSMGFGKSQPVASNDTAAGRQQNRRVEIVIKDKLTVGTLKGQ
ncbi:MAG: OmpA family protein [Acidobacteria bacterium]|nr:OmpA family protein [Acidobacteriota bacterium]MBI3423547.1 OmpA family protein [Acidobacteriota bacterium]